MRKALRLVLTFLCSIYPFFACVAQNEQANSDDITCAFDDLQFGDSRNVAAQKMKDDARIRLSGAIEFFSSYTAENAPLPFWLKYGTIVDIGGHTYDFKCGFYQDALYEVEISTSYCAVADYNTFLKERWDTLVIFMAEQYSKEFLTHTSDYPKIFRLKPGINYTHVWEHDTKKVRIGIIETDDEKSFSVVLLITHLPLEALVKIHQDSQGILPEQEP